MLLMIPGLSKKMRITLGLTTILAVILVETIVSVILMQYYPLEIINTSFILLSSGYWPICVLLILLSVYMAKFNIHPGTSILTFVRRRRDRNIPALMLFFFTQILSSTFLLVFRKVGSPDPKFIDILLTLSTILTLATLILVLKLFTQVKNEAVKSTQQFYIDDINRMFTTVRGQRHDFLNHVQVISSLLKMRKLDELDKYTKELIGETTEINEIMNIGNPALAALIQAKSTIAFANKIQFNFDCTGMESSALGVKSIDLIKVLGNLLDNAFDEAMHLPPGERMVELYCLTEKNHLHIRVNNRGSYISEDIQRNLFVPGFSTKPGEHHGLGLPIVKERIDFYQGTIEVRSCREEGTSFHIRIPLKHAI
jgi:signal transduction histidine kinase